MTGVPWNIYPYLKPSRKCHQRYRDHKGVPQAHFLSRIVKQCTSHSHDGDPLSLIHGNAGRPKPNVLSHLRGLSSLNDVQCFRDLDQTILDCLAKLDLLYVLQFQAAAMLGSVFEQSVQPLRPDVMQAVSHARAECLDESSSAPECITQSVR